jgi:hypothetical protein
VGSVYSVFLNVPAEKMEVTMSAFVKSGSTLRPMFFIAITYGELAPVPVSAASNNLTSVGSSYGRIMPTQSAPIIKKRPNRQYIVLKAALIVLRGYMASPATMATYSGPTIVKEA